MNFTPHELNRLALLRDWSAEFRTWRRNRADQQSQLETPNPSPE